MLACAVPLGMTVVCAHFVEAPVLSRTNLIWPEAVCKTRPVGTTGRPDCTSALKSKAMSKTGVFLSLVQITVTVIAMLSGKF